MKKKTINYVNNNEFFELLKQRIEKRKEAEAAGLPSPRICEKLGAIILAMSVNISNKFNFVNYTYKEDMVGDGILNAIKAIDSFDPEKSNNPFGYFTFIIWRAFLRRIEREKKEFSGKEKVMFDLVEKEMYSLQEGDTSTINRDETFLWYNQEYL